MKVVTFFCDVCKKQCEEADALGLDIKVGAQEPSTRKHVCGKCRRAFEVAVKGWEQSCASAVP